MIFNLTSRLIINILMPNFDIFLRSISGSFKCAFSPLMEHENSFFNYDILCVIQFRRGKKNIDIELYADGFKDEAKEKIIKHIYDNLYHTKVILNFIFKINLQTDIIKNTDIVSAAEKKARIDISVSSKDNDSYLSLLIPLDFLKLFSAQIKSLNIELIEREIVNFFKNPVNLFPDLKTILDTLNEKDIQRLFFHLQKKNLLTPYQISLMLLSFKQHTLLIKNNLSSNIINDVNKIIKDFKINKRDIMGGIYSIEESIYMSMKNNDSFAFSAFLTQMQKGMKNFLNSQVLLKNSFLHWLEEMNSQDQLYNVLSITREEDIVKSVSDNPDIYYSLLSGFLPEKRLQEIFSLSKSKAVSLIERIESQSNFISNYKQFKIKRLNMSYKTFPVLLRKIGREEIVYLLLGVGWFVLSTAFKNMDKKKILDLMDKIPLGAKYLVIDVLQGIINPNIIHDEMQINRARSICVNELFSLYQDGIIDLL